MHKSPFVVSLADLPRQEGTHVDVHTSVAAPESFATDLLEAVGDIDLDLALQSVAEGVLVTGTGRVDVDGQCARCLTEIHTEIETDITELVYYPDRARALADSGDSDAEGAPVIVDDTIDLEPFLRDGIVGQMPFIPLCSDDCEGLCSRCGERLADLPDDHAHEEAPRERTALDELKDKLIAEENE